MTKDEIEFTKSWWFQVCRDDEKFSRWIKKLQVTEIGGYDDHINFLASEMDFVSERDRKILINIAEDEKKHSGILLELMEDRKISPSILGPETTSSYWSYMNQQYATLPQYAAVNHFGEALAADRFEIILDHPKTPSDVVQAIRLILPDEVFHRETLQRMAGEEALMHMKLHHDFAFYKLIRK
jgi:rubrerythrin